MISDYRDENYANIHDIEYIFGDIDKYYAPILTSSLFDNGYQRYYSRVDMMGNMSVKSYFKKILPYLRVLIDKNKVYEQKIQIDIGFNMVHLSHNRRSTHFSRSDNVICLPSTNTNEILEQLLTSLYDKFNDDLQLSRESSSFVFESVEECNIHFNKIDLRSGASFIDTFIDWLKHKKATINPQNIDDVYCFMYAIDIAMYHSEFGKNPGRISQNLRLHTDIFNWHDINFPASYEDYATFERLNSEVALNILYVPFEEQNVCPEYISNCIFDKKDQIILLKISDDKGKWHFLALPSVLDEDGVKRPYKSLSRLMDGISSKSNNDFYYLGCFNSFRTETTLKNHVDLCKNNKFAKIELPEEDSNFKRYKPSAKSLKMDTVIYADFESILVPYNTCDKEHETCEKVNKQVPCGYSINVVSAYSKSSKQTYHRGDNALSAFCKEIRNLAYKFINIYKQPMIDLTELEIHEYENAEYCHICKKVFGEAKKHRKVRDHDHYTGTFRGAAHSICNLRYSTQKDISVFFHDGTNYDFNLVINQLAKKFRLELHFIPLNGEKFMSFSIPIRKKVEANSKNTKKMLLTSNLKFIDSERHMNESL